MIVWANLLYPRGETVWEEDAATPPPTTVQMKQETYEDRRVNVANTHTEEVHTAREEQVQNVYRTEVHVEVVNHNEIRSEADMERLADHFAEGLREKLYAAVEGVYA